MSGAGSRAKHVAAKRVYGDRFETGGAWNEFSTNTEIQRLREWFSRMVNRNLSHYFLSQLITQFICCHCLVLIHVIVVQEREPSKASSFCISIQLARLDFGLVQYQYELKWTIQSTVYKWRKCRLETYKFLLCTVLATVLCHMALKQPWGIYFLERVDVLLLSLTSEKLFSIHLFFT